MIASMVSALFISLLILFFQRKQLQELGRPVRYATYVILLLSSAIWVYTRTAEHVWYMTVGMENLVDPLIPFREDD